MALGTTWDDTKEMVNYGDCDTKEMVNYGDWRTEGAKIVLPCFKHQHLPFICLHIQFIDFNLALLRLAVLII